MNERNLWKLIVLSTLLLASCSSQTPQPTPRPTPLPDPKNIFTDEEEATLNSLEQVDDHPLYTMRYFGMYTIQAHSREPAGLSKPSPSSASRSG